MTPIKPRLTHYKAQIERDHLGQSDLSDGFGGWREATVEIESVPQLYRPRQAKKGERKNKYLIRFRGKRKGWLSGPATQEVIAGMYGPYLENWVGKRITLYVDPDVRFGPAKVGGIRVRPTIPKGETTADPLDNPIDEEAAAKREAIADDVLGGDERQPGDD